MPGKKSYKSGGVHEFPPYKESEAEKRKRKAAGKPARKKKLSAAKKKVEKMGLLKELKKKR